MMDKKQERTWASACHLSTLLWIPLSMIGLDIPFINIAAPAFIWYLKKNESEFIDAHGKEAFNFQISMTLYCLAAVMIFAVLLFIGTIIFLILGNTDGNPLDGDLLTVFFAVIAGIGFLSGFLLLSAIAIFELAVVIFASIKAQEGQMYHYPFNLRLL